MQVKCFECSRAINIPDDKLPKDKAVTVACPGCKNKIKVDAHLKKEEEASQPVNTEKKPSEELVDTSKMVKQTEFDEDELVVYDEGDQIALVLDERHKDHWVKHLEELDYKIEFARSPEHAVHKMKFTQYHMVVLDDHYGKRELNKNPVYISILEEPMTSRRKLFFILVSDKVKSASNMHAFQFSANLVINEKDLDKTPIILKKGISENETFYKVFKDTLHELGKI